MKKLLLSSLVAISLLGTQAIALDAKANSSAVSKSAITKAKKVANTQKDDVKIVKEAVESVQLVSQVLAALEQNKKDEAIKLLEKAIGKIEVVLSNPKAPALLPIDAKVVVQEFLGSSNDAFVAVLSAEALLRAGKVQDARHIVTALVDEIDFTTVNLPLATYPIALKVAAKYLHDNKVEAAKAVLAQALSTFVNITVVTPLGILEAQELIEAASQIASTDKKLALAHLEQAKEALRKAKILGYTSSSDVTYKMLNEAISKIEKEIKGGNKVEKLFKELIEKIKDFKEKALSKNKK